MAPRPIWKGRLEIGQLACPVALHAAASTAERVSFHIVNRKTGHRVRRVFVDAETGEPVDRDEQAKGYETDRGKTVVIDEEELAEAVPESDKTLHVEAFVPCAEIDTLYFDRPYYLTPDGEAAETAYAVIRAGLAKKKAAAVARTVLFRRLRPVLIRAQGPGLVANTLEFDHEVRDAAKVFDDIPEMKLDEEMLDLARHIIGTKRGKFQPERFEDRYDDALAALVKAKAEGKALPKPKEPEAAKPIDLMEALRKSAAAKAKTKAKPKAPAKRAASRRKAG
jgi:DNA end-binding protein Ku